MGLALCQEKRWPKASATKHRDKSAKGKYNPDADKMREEDSAEFYDDRSSAVTNYDESESLDAMSAFRNNRAIDNSRYVIKNPEIYEFGSPIDIFRVPVNIEIYKDIISL